PSCVVSGTAPLAHTVRPDARAPAASPRPHISPRRQFCPRLARAIPFQVLPSLSVRAPVSPELPQHFRHLKVAGGKHPPAFFRILEPTFASVRSRIQRPPQSG